MATTIKLKNGSGAPLAGDLVAGEPALDLTNKRLYTEDSGGTVIEIGTSPSTIDINAGTIDGTVIGGSSAAAGTFTTFTSTGIDDNATSTAITINSSENVGIGTTNPGSKLVVEAGDDDGIRIDSSDDTFTGRLSFGDVSDNYIGAIEYDHNVDAMWFYVNNAERMRILSTGGLTFNGDTATANALDDYEEGTFTPRIEDDSGNAASIGTSDCSYIKIGSQVTLFLELANIDTTGMVASEDIRITNVPFYETSDGGAGSVILHGFNFSGSVSLLATSSNFRLRQTVSGSGDSNLPVSAIVSSTSDIAAGTISYLTS